MTAAQMTQFLHKEIPLCQFMQLSVDKLSGMNIEASAPIAPNINLHQSGFAGSLYALAVATGWAFIYHFLRTNTGNPEQYHPAPVLKKAEIFYRLPVKQRIAISSGFCNQEQAISLQQQLSRKDKLNIPLQIKIFSANKQCARVLGEYIVLN